MPTITAKNVSKYYKKSWRERRAAGKKYEVGVEDVNLTIEQGEFVFIIGSSGAGKSTLLSLLGGTVKPNRGSVALNGINMNAIRRTQPAKLAHTFGRVTQQHSLERTMTVRENLEQAVRFKWKKDGEKAVEERVRKVLGLVGLPEMEDRYPGELTAGERRRVELARAMINSPPILILDEVIANLDEDSIWDTFLLLTEINRKGTTVIMSTHNSQYVNMLRRRVITLVDGRVYGDVDKGRYGEVAEKKSAVNPLII